jgi:peptidoglycan/LPS O-acetylase OafA/YrhL
VPRGSHLRPLLRWTSLVAGFGVLAVLGQRRLHLHDFVLFLAIVLGLAIAIVAVFVFTARPDDARP